MREERYYLHTPRGAIPLPGTLRPSQLMPTGVTPNLVRARGYATVYDLSDGLPDPLPLVLSGVVCAEGEAELSLLLAELQADLRQATHISRNERKRLALRSGHVLAAPASEDSNEASVTLTLILKEVPYGKDVYFW